MQYSKLKNQPENSIYIPMTTEEAVALAINCKKVISIRSGFCDLIYFKCADLKVLYHRYSKFYSFSNIHKNISGINTNVKDAIVDYDFFLANIVKSLCKSENLTDIAPLGKATQSSLSKWSKPDDAQRAVIDIGDATF
ncbi:MAG: hypothetical protein LBD84_01900, partial [Campylobacteraceae bacterium]|nr:hypothetical protein [Campylobacteraceae bacterium]